MTKQTEAERPTTEDHLAEPPETEQSPATEQSETTEQPKTEGPKIAPLDPRPWAAARAPRPAAWVGFLELEEWARAVDPSRPVLLLPLVEPASVDGPFHHEDLVHHEDLLVVCQQVTAEGDVLYCRLRAGTVTRVCGALADADWREREMAWESLWECAEGLLLERGLRVLPAAVAWPSGARYLRGHSGAISYDPRHRVFRRLPGASL